MSEAETTTSSHELVPAPIPRRLLAFIIDCLILNALGKAVCYVFFDPLAALTPHAGFVGIVLVFCYFHFTQGFTGQSPGKRLLDIRLLARRGAPSRRVHAIRTLLYVAIVFPSAAFLFPTHQMQLLPFGGAGFAIAIAAVFSFLLTQSVMLLLVARNRRALHDLAAGTCVVRRRIDAAPPFQMARTAPAHWIIATGVAIFFVFMTTQVLIDNARPREHYGAVNVAADEDIYGAYYYRVPDFFEHPNVPPGTMLVLHILLREFPDSARGADFAGEKAREILTSLPGMSDLAQIRVELIRQANIGFAVHEDTRPFDITLADTTLAQ